jgi:hypothetical protein
LLRNPFRPASNTILSPNGIPKGVVYFAIIHLHAKIRTIIKTGTPKPYPWEAAALGLFFFGSIQILLFYTTEQHFLPCVSLLHVFLFPVN